MAVKKKFKIDLRIIRFVSVVVAFLLLLALIASISQCCAKNKFTPVGGEDTYSSDVAAGYTIEIDQNFFVSEKNDGFERISVISNPEAYMTISNVAGITYTDYIEVLMSETILQISEKNMKIEGIENSLGMSYSTGSLDNDIVTTIYAIDNGKNGCFVIKYINTNEAKDDIGARFEEIARTFKVI